MIRRSSFTFSLILEKLSYPGRDDFFKLILCARTLLLHFIALCNFQFVEIVKIHHPKVNDIFNLLGCSEENFNVWFLMYGFLNVSLF